MSSEADHETIELQPFAHQVGGHNIVLQINQSTICKPYLDREVNFYSHLPEELKEFTPPFQGVINVSCHRTNDSLVFHGDIPKTTLNNCGCNGNNSLHSINNGTRYYPNTHISHNNSENSDRMAEDWSHRCIERHTKSWLNNPSQKFIILGNLLESYNKPCTMDLKMGTKQHADIATGEKRKLLEERCASSTSSSLGFRINGSQMYKADSNSYVSRDKYFGRQLDPSGVNSELYSFFHDGFQLRCDVIRIVTKKLQSLKNVLSNQKTFCFFSCSLLLLYDGAVPQESDVENDKSMMLSKDVIYPTEEDSCVQMSDSKTEEHNERCNTERSDSETFCKAAIGNGTRCKADVSSHSQCKADVRLIDFAHTLLKQDIGDQIAGNEFGLLEGLNNLIRMLEQLQSL